jgi:predicted TIM-barrel fold metal-dependent hydrolase
MIIDSNVYLGSWPFRHFPWPETAQRVRKLRDSGVTQAWVGSFDGLLHKDLASVNARLAAECRRHGDGFLVPFGSVNPRLPDWEEELRRCQEVHQMPGIRLHPGHHGYRLSDAVCTRLLEQASRRRLLVQLVVKMEDERTQHPLMRVPAVDTRPLPGLLAELRELRLILLNGLGDLRGDELVTVVRSGQVFVEIAMLEGVGGVARLVQSLGSEKLLFGSHFPFFCWEAAALKLREADLRDTDLQAIQSGNARHLLPGS